MKLFLLQRLEAQDRHYDVANGFVVRASNEKQARVFASERHGDEGSQVWLEPARTACEVLTASGTRGVIMRNYRAG